MKTNKTEQDCPINPGMVEEAIKIGKSSTAKGQTKLDTTLQIFPLLNDEPISVAASALQKATGMAISTAKTYMYKIRREFRKP